ncbi:hypothetical protein JGT96_08100 [Enterobacter hormaechei]|nr:RHS repeat-associated core domain-containing protein [Enterobacter hormaechei]MBJ6590595.1 hypothetical protein [Enterobacter hormaechei]MBK4578774.1 hypothetical protein [Enterobacter hormaechei]
MITGECGKVCWSGQYGSFGEVRHQSEGFSRLVNRTAMAHQPLRYAGQYADGETGLHYNLFCYYDPQVGRFIVQDLIGLNGGWNLYQYAPNPLGWIYPLGLSTCSSKDSYKQARNKALKWLEERGFKAEKVNTGKFGSTKGQPVGMTTIDGKTGSRVEYDERSGAHINVFSGKDKGEHFMFDAPESVVTKIQYLFNLPSKPWRGY